VWIFDSARSLLLIQDVRSDQISSRSDEIGLDFWLNKSDIALSSLDVGTVSILLIKAHVVKEFV